MKVIYSPSSLPDWVVADAISRRSDDECFSPELFARECNISIEEALRRLNTMGECLIAYRWDPQDPAPQSPTDRWLLYKHPLTVGRAYEVLAIEADSYRLLNDPQTKPYGNDPILFPAPLFIIADATEPAFWDNKTDQEGNRCAGPPEWLSTGFFEDYHDGVPHIRTQFWSDIHRYYPETARERGIPLPTAE